MSVRSEPTPAVDRAAVNRPQLLFFCDETSGQSRRVEGFLAQVLQRRRNHDTFQLHRIDHHTRAELARRCKLERFPALVVVENKRIQLRLEQPRGCTEIRKALTPWLR